MTKEEWAELRGMRPGVRKQFGPLQSVVESLPHSIFDHPSIWRTGSGGWALVCQPYHFHHDAMQTLVNVCEREGVEAEVDPHANWHDPNVIGIVIKTLDA